MTVLSVPLRGANVEHVPLPKQKPQRPWTSWSMTFATDYQPGDAYDRSLKGLASMDRQLERNGMKRSLTADDIRTAHKTELWISSEPGAVV